MTWLIYFDITFLIGYLSVAYIDFRGMYEFMPWISALVGFLGVVFVVLGLLSFLFA